jgi:DNA replication protein DnaC
MKRLDSLMKTIGGDLLKADHPGTGSANKVANSECPLCGGLGYIARDLPTSHPDFGRLFPCSCKLAEVEERRQQHLRAVSNLDQLSLMTFETFVPDGYSLLPDKAANLRSAYEQAQQFAADPSGWLIFFGGYGCGKTHLAAAIANRAVERGQAVLFIVVPDLLDYLRATFSPNSPVGFDERFEEVRNAPLLILDDLGTQSSTPWAQEKLFQILNHRYNARLSTVMTSNQSLEEIDLRLRSRMMDLDLTVLVTILAPDFRSSGLGKHESDLSSLSLMQNMTFESFSLRQDELEPGPRINLEETVALCRSYAEFPKGWLVLAGQHGCGKTHLAAAIANKREAARHPALFVVVPDLLDHLRATFSPSSQVRFDQRFEEVRRAPLLVLDDLGTESASPWAQEKLYQLLNHRYNAMLPTVITMAQTLEDLHPGLRARISDKERVTFQGISAPSYWRSLENQAGHKTRTSGRGSSRRR